VRVVRAAFPHLNGWLNDLPDPRMQVMCLYSADHLRWQNVLVVHGSVKEKCRHGFPAFLRECSLRLTRACSCPGCLLRG
jgi:hypothetical protein